MSQNAKAPEPTGTEPITPILWSEHYHWAATAAVSANNRTSDYPTTLLSPTTSRLVDPFSNLGLQFCDQRLEKVSIRSFREPDGIPWLEAAAVTVWLGWGGGRGSASLTKRRGFGFLHHAFLSPTLVSVFRRKLFLHVFFIFGACCGALFSSPFLFWHFGIHCQYPKSVKHGDSLIFHTNTLKFSIRARTWENMKQRHVRKKTIRSDHSKIRGKSPKLCQL